MKIFVKTLKDTYFEIEVNPEDTVADVKKHIEAVQGSNTCPAAQQLLVYQGKVLNNDTTLLDNKVVENSFVVIVRTKTKGSPGEGSSVSSAPTAKVSTSKPLAPPSPVPAPVSPAAQLNRPEPTPAPARAPASTSADALPPVPAPAAAASPTLPESGAHGQGASNPVVVTNFNHIVQQILDMGGGSWDTNTVVRALRAAHNNPDRAVEYLYSGIPEQAAANVAPEPANPAAPQPPAQPISVPSSRPNANLPDLFPQGFPSAASNTRGAGVLDFLRHSPRFQALRAIVQANPQMLQPMLQELGKQNPQVVRLIQEHQADFLRLINEPIEGGEGSNILGQLPTVVPQAIQVTPAEHEAIERLEAMGFERATVLEVYFACNKNEELAANYLLDHLHEFED